MSACAGIDVRRKRSQVAVVARDGQVQLNRNVVNGRPRAGDRAARRRAAPAREGGPAGEGLEDIARDR
jgi:hypothetical protein